MAVARPLVDHPELGQRREHGAVAHAETCSDLAGAQARLLVQARHARGVDEQKAPRQRDAIFDQRQPPRVSRLYTAGS